MATTEILSFCAVFSEPDFLQDEKFTESARIENAQRENFKIDFFIISSGKIVDRFNLRIVLKLFVEYI